MVCYCLDLRGDSKVGQFLGNKIVSFVTGIVQLILWVSTLMNFIIQPEPVKKMIQNMDNATFVLSIVLTIIIIAFSVLLLFGLYKDSQGYIKSYLIFNMVLTVLFAVSFFINLFIHPKKFGVSGFLSTVLIISLNILFFFIIRNYYLSFLSKQSNRNPA